MQQAKEQVVIRFVETITLWPFDTQLCLVSFSRATMLCYQQMGEKEVKIVQVLEVSTVMI